MKGVGIPMSEKDKHREQLESMIDNWNAEFDQLEVRIRLSGADPRIDYDEVITALRQHRKINSNQDQTGAIA